MSRDLISIRGLTVQGIHGVLPAEKLAPQPFIIDADLAVDLSVSAGSDDLADTVSYAEVADEVVHVVESDSVDLIEHLAARIAAVCLRHDAVETVTVTVHKPLAPLSLTFDDVAVTMRRAQERLATIALGGNLGDPAQLLRTLTSAVHALAELPATRLLAVSGLVESDALATNSTDSAPQPPYLNAVALLRTDLHPRTLLRHLHDVEADHGRVRTTRWGARTLDLDLIDVAEAAPAEAVGAQAITAGQHVLATVRPRGPSWRRDRGPVLLPHPRAHERPFVTWPWYVVDPAAHPAEPSAHGLRPGPAWPSSVQRWVRESPLPESSQGAPGSCEPGVADE